MARLIILTFMSFLLLAGCGNNQKENDPETILLIDSWASQEAIDAHHATPMMANIAALREKYDLHMTVERYTGADMPATDNQFIRQ